MIWKCPGFMTNHYCLVDSLPFGRLYQSKWAIHSENLRHVTHSYKKDWYWELLLGFRDQKTVLDILLTVNVLLKVSTRQGRDESKVRYELYVFPASKKQILPISFCEEKGEKAISKSCKNCGSYRTWRKALQVSRKISIFFAAICAPQAL